MPARGLEQVRRRLTQALNDIDKRAARAAYEAAVTGGGLADVMTPQDTGNLINSRYVVLNKAAKGWTAQVGYTAAYAAAVHDAKGKYVGTETPRDPGDPSRGNFWDPDAEPEFLKKAMESPDVDRAFRRVLDA